MFVLDKFEREISGQGPVRAGKGLPLFISNENTEEIIKIVVSLEKSGLLIDGATETVKCEIKKQEGVFLGAMADLDGKGMQLDLYAPAYAILKTHHWLVCFPISSWFFYPDSSPDFFYRSFFT